MHGAGRARHGVPSWTVSDSILTQLISVLAKQLACSEGDWPWKLQVVCLRARENAEGTPTSRSVGEKRKAPAVKGARD